MTRYADLEVHGPTINDRLRVHALGPEKCKRCGQLRDNEDLGLCLEEGQCYFYMHYGLQTDGGIDVHAAKADMVEAANELDFYDSLFDLRWQADMRATKMWRDAHPGNDLVIPDHADLVVWLLEQMGKMRRTA